jgi:hypothetical protein
MKHELTPEIAARFAEAALGHVRREYPHKLDHVMEGPEDVLGRARFTRSSSEASTGTAASTATWTLAAHRRLFPSLPPRSRIGGPRRRDANAGQGGGRDGLSRPPYSGGFERPYGWAWLLALHLEASRRQDAEWDEALAPLA